MIPFTFDPVSHVYSVQGHYCLSTSDIISLAGLSDYGQVPQRVLDNAADRGTRVHKAIQFFEENDLNLAAIPDDIKPYFRAYMKFRRDMDFEPVPPQEKQIVYQHQNTEQMIGCTIDLRGTIGGKLYIVDPKCTYPNSGAAKKQTWLRWRMQLQSYWEATAIDEDFWTAAGGYEGIRKAILHLKKDATYELIEFPVDDYMDWDACIRIAKLKLANGWKRNEKNAAVGETEPKSYVSQLTEMVATNDAAYIQSLMDDVAIEPVIP